MPATRDTNHTREDNDREPLEALMARFVKSNDEAAFGEIVSALADPALAVARQILGDRSLAEDAVQEAFLRVVRCRRQYRPSWPFSRWFYAILRNVCLDTLRRRRREMQAMSEAFQAAETEPVAMDTANTAADATDLLAGLPEVERAVLTLRIMHGLPLSDVAAALGMSYEAAKKRAQRALERLRQSRAARDAIEPRPHGQAGFPG